MNSLNSLFSFSNQQTCKGYSILCFGSVYWDSARSSLVLLLQETNVKYKNTISYSSFQNSLFCLLIIIFSQWMISLFLSFYFCYICNHFSAIWTSGVWTSLHQYQPNEEWQRYSNQLNLFSFKILQDIFILLKWLNAHILEIAQNPSIILVTFVLTSFPKIVLKA